MAEKNSNLVKDVYDAYLKQGGFERGPMDALTKDIIANPSLFKSMQQQPLLAAALEMRLFYNKQLGGDNQKWDTATVDQLDQFRKTEFYAQMTGQKLEAPTAVATAHPVTQGRVVSGNAFRTVAATPEDLSAGRGAKIDAPKVETPLVAAAPKPDARVADLQRALLFAKNGGVKNIDLGKYGPDKNGIDGLRGGRTNESVRSVFGKDLSTTDALKAFDEKLKSDPAFRAQVMEGLRQAAHSQDPKIQDQARAFLKDRGLEKGNMTWEETFKKFEGKYGALPVTQRQPQSQPIVPVTLDHAEDYDYLKGDKGFVATLSAEQRKLYAEAVNSSTLKRGEMWGGLTPPPNKTSESRQADWKAFEATLNPSQKAQFEKIKQANPDYAQPVPNRPSLDLRKLLEEQGGLKKTWDGVAFEDEARWGDTLRLGNATIKSGIGGHKLEGVTQNSKVIDARLTDSDHAWAKSISGFDAKTGLLKTDVTPDQKAVAERGVISIDQDRQVFVTRVDPVFGLMRRQVDGLIGEGTNFHKLGVANVPVQDQAGLTPYLSNISDALKGHAGFNEKVGFVIKLEGGNMMRVQEGGAKMTLVDPRNPSSDDQKAIDQTPQYLKKDVPQWWAKDYGTPERARDTFKDYDADPVERAKREAADPRVNVNLTPGVRFDAPGA